MLFIYKMFVNYSQLQFGLFCKMMINLKLNSIHKHIYFYTFIHINEILLILLIIYYILINDVML